MKRQISILKLSFFFVFTTVSIAYAEDRIREEFQRDAPVAWERYLEQFKNVGVSCRETTRAFEDGEGSTETVEWSCEVVLPYRIETYKKIADGGSSSEIMADNPQYVFSLSSNSDPKSAESQTIDRVEKRKGSFSGRLQFPQIENFTNHKPLKDLPYENRLLLGMAEALKIHFLFWFPSIAQEKEFEIVEITEENEENSRVVRIDYRYEPDGVVGVVGPTVPRSGRVWLLPDNSWVVKRASFDALDAGDRETKVHVETEISYQSLEDPSPLPTRVATRCSYPSLRATEAEFEKEFVWNRDVVARDKKEYYLSFYGFPEPEFEDGFRLLRPALILLGLTLLFLAYRTVRKGRIFGKNISREIVEEKPNS